MGNVFCGTKKVRKLLRLILRKGSATEPTQAGGVTGIRRKKAFMKTVNELGGTIGTQKMAIFFLSMITQHK